MTQIPMHRDCLSTERGPGQDDATLGARAGLAVAAQRRTVLMQGRDREVLNGPVWHETIAHGIQRKPA